MPQLSFSQCVNVHVTLTADPRISEKAEEIPDPRLARLRPFHSPLMTSITLTCPRTNLPIKKDWLKVFVNYIIKRIREDAVKSRQSFNAPFGRGGGSKPSRGEMAVVTHPLI